MVCRRFSSAKPGSGRSYFSQVPLARTQLVTVLSARVAEKSSLVGGPRRERNTAFGKHLAVSATKYNTPLL